MRDRTKMQWVVTVWMILMVSFIVVGNTFSYRENAAALVIALVSGDVVKWAAHVAGVVRENVEEVKNRVVKNKSGVGED